MSKPEDKNDPSIVRITRREFVKLGGATVSGSIASGFLPAMAAAPAKPGGDAYPARVVARISAMKINEPVQFTYPDDSSPAIAVRLPGPASGGVGPGNSIVAYSILCTHKGCPVSYRPERKLLICPCHWSSFDPAKDGEMVIGQGSQALPRIILRTDGDAVQAIGVEGLIYGRQVNIL